MALVLKDRVKETTTTTGTGTINLAGAASGFQSFVSGVGDGNTTYYTLLDANGTAWEVGIGTITDASPDTLARTTILASTNSNNALTLTSGTHTVFATYPAGKAVYLDASGNLSHTVDVSSDTNLAAGTNISLSGDTLNVDDAFLINSGDDTTTGVITAGGFTTTGTWTFDEHTSGTVGIVTVQDSGTSFVDNDTSLMTAAAIDDRILDYGYSTTTGTVTSVATAGTVNGITLTGGAITSTGTITLGGTLADITVSQLHADAVQTSGESFADNDTSLMTSASIADKIEAYGYTTNAGDMTGVDLTAGTGITIDSETNTTSGNYSATITCTVTDTNTQLTTEQVQDIVGGMVTGNTETGIAVTYEDGDGTLDFVIGTLNQDTTGNAATATALETARTINGTSFDGTANITITAAGSTLSDTVTVAKGGTGATTLDNLITLGTHTTGNYVATIADAGNSAITVANSGSESAAITLDIADNAVGIAELAGIARGKIIVGDASGNPALLAAGDEDQVLTIDSSGDAVWAAVTGGSTLTDEQVQDKVGAMFSGNTETGITATYQDADGTIDLVVGTLNQDTTGNAATATALETARTINGTSFDGTGNITITAAGSTLSDTVTVAKGGTGATSLTDGGVLLGSGTDAITATAVLGNGELLIGDNSTDPAVATLTEGSNVTITNGAGTITIAAANDNTQLSTEQVQDIVGGMVTGNTETGISVTYEDGDGTLDFVVGTLNQDTTGTAAIATTITLAATNTTDATHYPVFVDAATGNEHPRTDTGLTYNPNSGLLTAAAFSGPLTGNVTGNASGSSGSCTGNAATATALATARNINGVSFDGTGNITVTAAGSTLSDTVTVAKGGTGATSLTDGGILLGSGTGAITALAVLGDGVIVVGDNSTDPTTITAFTASDGVLKHEVGGLELDISGIAIGDVLAGTGTGAVGIVTSTGHSDGDVLTIQADGTVDWEAAGGGGISHDGSTANGVLTYKDSDEATVEATLTYDGTTLLASSTTDNTPPIVLLKHAFNDTTGSILKFVLDRGAAGTDGDVCGTITFYGDDDNQDNIEFARIEGIVADASNGDECGGLKFYVAENDGNNTAGLSLTGSTTDGEVDVTVGAGAASVVTIPGHIDLAGDIDVDGTLEADAITLGGTALGSLYSVIAGSSSIVTVGTVTTGTWNGTAIATAYIADDAVTGAKIALFDDSLAATTTHFLIADGTDYSSFALSGDVTCTNAGVVSIADDVISSAELADACSAVTSFTAPLIEGSTSIQTPLIEYTDGDDAITIHDGGSITLAKAVYQPIANAEAEPEDATVTIDLRKANYFDIELGANVTNINLLYGKVGQRFMIRFEQDASANYTIAWNAVTNDFDGGGSAVTAAISWPGGTAPVMTATNDKADTFGFVIRAEGHMDAFVIGQNMPVNDN